VGSLSLKASEILAAGSKAWPFKNSKGEDMGTLTLAATYKMAVKNGEVDNSEGWGVSGLFEMKKE
jgi:hypothetical protein